MECVTFLEQNTPEVQWNNLSEAINVGNVGSVGNLHMLVHIIGFPNTVDINPIYHFPRHHHLRVTVKGTQTAIHVQCLSWQSCWT